MTQMLMETLCGVENADEVETPPKSVVFVLSALGAGGAERVVSLIGNSWREAGRHVTVITFDRDDELCFHSFAAGTTLCRLGIPAARAGRVAAVLTTIRRIVALRRAILAADADLVISFLTKINVLTLLACLFTRQRVVISERNNPRLQEKSRAWNALLAALSWRANAIVMQTVASLACLGPRTRSRAIVISNPIQIGDLDRRGRTPLVLAAAGRLTHQKGFDLLIAAFARVAARHPGWRLVIWGDGDLRDALQRQIDATGLGDRITMPGNSADPDEWVASADAFVVSSRYEGFCNALGEALAAGVPAASAACDYGPSDMISHDVNGLLAPVEDVDALAAAIDRLMADGALRERLGNAARRSMVRFSPPIILARWDDLVNDVLAQAGPQRTGRRAIRRAAPARDAAHRGTGRNWSIGFR